jgi:hypothetical protein
MTDELGGRQPSDAEREPDEQEDAVDGENRIRTTSAGTVSAA